jgi:hypothetical protein
MLSLISVFAILLCYLTLPTCIRFVRSKIPVPDALLQRRYETIEGWLISKV